MSTPRFDAIYDMPITKDVSQVLAEYYGFKCQISGCDVSNGSFHVDHIYPKSLGGMDNLQNYAIADASANIGKGARRHAPHDESVLLAIAREAAPTLMSFLTELRRDTGGASINPIVVRAFRLLGLTVGTRVASGAYLRAFEGPAEGVRWWGYWGPDKNIGASDILQFGVKIFAPGRSHLTSLQEAADVTQRGGDTFYISVPARLPMDIDRDALFAAKRRFETLL